MVYKNLIRIFDERRRKLTGLVSDNSVQLKPERKQQIQGAIDEIDLFLLTLRQHQDQHIHRNFSRPVTLQDEKQGLFSKMFKKDMTSRNFALNEQVVQ